MKVWLPLLLCAALLCSVPACRKSSNSPIPFVELIALSPDTIKTGSLKDTLFITFNFSDGDGDLGNDVTQRLYDVFLHDDRDNSPDSSLDRRYPFPPIPDEARDLIDGLKGRGAIALYGSTLTVRQDTIHKFRGDTVNYHMWIVDRAQHRSNVITIPPIYIRP